MKLSWGHGTMKKYGKSDGTISCMTTSILTKEMIHVTWYLWGYWWDMYALQHLDSFRFVYEM